MFSDDDTSLIRAALCSLAHDGRLPVRYRMDTVAAHLRRGFFLGQPRAIERLRYRLTKIQSSRAPRVTVPRQPVSAESTPRPGAAADRADVQPRVTAPVETQQARCAITSDRLRAQITTDANLYAAWERVRDNARSRGNWSHGFKRFENDLSGRLRTLADGLRDGSWQPAPLAHVRIPKPNGGTRHLHIPPVADRVVERAITQVISHLIDPHLSPWSYAFRPGRGVGDAVREVAFRRDDGATHVARFDVVDCFGTVDHQRLRSALRSYLDDPWLLTLVDLLLARDLPGVPRRQGLVGIAQGAPLSPLLANLVLEDLDTALYRAGFPPIRYADDLAVPTADAVQAQTALQVAQDAAEELGMSINAEKSSVTSFSAIVPFLGERIGPDSPFGEDSRAAPLPSKRTVYLSAKAGSVQIRRGQVRVLTKDREQLLSVPVSSVARIVVMGPANISAGLRSYAFRNDLEVLFLSRNGTWLGRYDGGCEIEPQLRRRQYELMDEPETRASIARCLAAGKIANQRALLLRYRRNDDHLDDGGAVDALAAFHQQILAATTPAQIMGYEGAATKRYHNALRSLFPPHARFRGRTKRPPRDPANAALSFGYTLLTGEAHAACASAGLDPQVGVLHSSGKHRPALAFDLVEEFRPLIVDSLVIAGFRRRRFGDSRFRKGDKGAILLNDRGRRTLLDQYESRMLSRYRSALSSTRHSYRAGLREQARHLAEVIAGRECTYRPVGWR